MKFITTIESYRMAMAGLLFVFAGHIITELSSATHIAFAIVAIVGGVALARITAQHFGHTHHHAGDSAIDAIPVAVLLLANIAHPAIDGFSAVETFKLGGVAAGSLYALSIVFHEILRQSAFITALSPLRVNWKWVVSTALFGIALGVGAAFQEGKLIGRYETLADLATLFSYSFVIAEFYVLRKHHEVNYTRTLFVIGICIGLLIIFFMNP